MLRTDRSVDTFSNCQVPVSKSQVVLLIVHLDPLTLSYVQRLITDSASEKGQLQPACSLDVGYGYF